MLPSPSLEFHILDGDRDPFRSHCFTLMKRTQHGAHHSKVRRLEALPTFTVCGRRRPLLGCPSDPPVPIGGRAPAPALGTTRPVSVTTDGPVPTRFELIFTARVRLRPRLRSLPWRPRSPAPSVEEPAAPLERPSHVGQQPCGVSVRVTPVHPPSSASTPAPGGPDSVAYMRVLGYFLPFQDCF